MCAITAVYTVGRVNVTGFEGPQLGELELLYTELGLGGSWAPRSCVSRQRVAVIVPYRDRQRHLRALLGVLHPMLQRQMLRYTVFVVEQVRRVAPPILAVLANVSVNQST